LCRASTSSFRRLGRPVNIGQELVDLVGRGRTHLHIELGGLLEEQLVLHGRIEGLAQRRLAIFRNSGRRKERPADRLSYGEDAQDLPLFVGLRVIRGQRDIRQVRMLGGSELRDHVDLLLAQPFRLLALQTGP
jgi:hypothetical protein